MFSNKNILRLRISDDSRRRLDDLKKVCEADSNVEIIREALKLYEGLVHKAQAGAEFYIKEPGSAEVVKHAIFTDENPEQDHRAVIGARAIASSTHQPSAT